LNGRNLASGSPFSARCLMMGADHGTVDHLEGIRDQRIASPELFLKIVLLHH